MNSCVFLLVLVAGVVSTKTFYPEISITGESGLRLGLVGKLLSLFVVNIMQFIFTFIRAYQVENMKLVKITN